MWPKANKIRYHQTQESVITLLTVGVGDPFEFIFVDGVSMCVEVYGSLGTAQGKTVLSPLLCYAHGQRAHSMLGGSDSGLGFCLNHHAHLVGCYPARCEMRYPAPNTGLPGSIFPPHCVAVPMPFASPFKLDSATECCLAVARIFFFLCRSSGKK